MTGSEQGSHPAERDNTGVNALQRGLRILECFGSDGRRLTLGQVTERTGLSAPTVWRYCYTLRKLGYLVWHSDETLSVGFPALGLGFAAASDLSFGELALPHLQSLAERFGCTAILGEAVPPDIIYLQVSSRHRITFSDFRAGSRDPMAFSPAGWACLAGMAQARQAPVLAAMARQNFRLPASFEQATSELRAKGYMVTRGLIHPELVAISIPLQPPGSGRLYAVTCAEHESALHDAAHAELGHALLEVGQACCQYLAGLLAADGRPG
ncbi:IclR family transcriptional regulator [Roseomonas chloroacetimidivorans]|uniref:IclR family transcriptional regulator n=1 Tax=Roseomonas chloroacetimidivorans TaxID=1766656 RepID=UPI003C75BAAD